MSLCERIREHAHRQPFLMEKKHNTAGQVDRMRIVGRIENVAVFAAYLPLLWVAMFWALVFRARLHLTYWPVYGRPDPKWLNFDVHIVAIYLSFLGAIFSLVPVAWAVLKGRLSKRSQRFYVGGVAATVATCIFGFRYIEWFLD